ncbi:glutathione S-transferase [Grus japonensis]|uniref:glutathione transferase n=2 Tax=Grus TaxID=9114 RepID=A0ABC9WKW2_GRUJA
MNPVVQFRAEQGSHETAEEEGKGNQELRSMSGKPRLTYCNGRGRMESVRWLLAAAGVEFEENFLETEEQYKKLIKDGVLMFQQVPLVEIDGMKMVQTRAILSYIAGKYNLYGKDLKERALIDMYVEGITDLMKMILMFPFSPPEAKEKNLDSIKERATNRYFPVFEKVLKQHGQDFLVGNKFSWADVQLIEAILAVEDNIPAVLSGFPQLQFEECFLETKDDLTKLQKDGSLLFQQVPMVEIDGMKMVQTRAISNYIAAKYNLYGKDLKERALIDMYVEAVMDLNELLMTHPLQPADKKEQHFATIVDKATNRYFPAYEKVLKDHGQNFLVGNQFSRADVQLLETLLMAEEYKPDILAKFPLLQGAVRALGAERAGVSVGGAACAEGSKNSEIMAGKPKLHYTNGRGKMESIRWLLAAAGVEFEEEFIETKEDLEKLRNDGSLLFQQVPMVEMDGMKMVQTRAILSYIAAKYNLYGKDLKERAWIDMYVEGTTDLMGMIMHLPFQPADVKEKNLALIIERATTRYFPVYEKALKDHGHDYLVGNKLSWADIHLLEAILMAEECKPDILSAFPLLQAFKGRTSNIPTIKKFLQPGSQRKPPTDEKSIAVVRKIFNI